MLTNLSTFLLDIWGDFLSIIKTIEFVDIVDILVLSFVIYLVVKFVRETRAEQLLKGILLLVIILLLIRQFEFKALGLLSETFFNVGFMAIIVMFQPELRRVLEKMGRTKMVQNIALSLENNPQDKITQVSYMIEQVAEACEDMAKTFTGALIVIERGTKLGEQIGTGTAINATPSVKLIKNIFFKNSPLHDGAMVIRDGAIIAAGCILPHIQNEEAISKNLGTRHRAAIGATEISDALVIVVSEETGIISIAENGTLRRKLNKITLSELLKDKLLNEKSESSSMFKKKKKRSITK